MVSSSSSLSSEADLSAAAGDFLVFLKTFRRRLDGDDPGGEAPIPTGDPAAAATSALESSEPASLLSPPSELYDISRLEARHADALLVDIYFI